MGNEMQASAGIPENTFGGRPTLRANVEVSILLWVKEHLGGNPYSLFVQRVIHSAKAKAINNSALNQPVI